MHNTMKAISILLLVALLLSTNGCMTYDAIEHTQGRPCKLGYFSFGVGDEQKNIDGKPHPEYWALLPLSIPADIAFSPLEIIFIPIAVAGAGGG